MVRLVLGSSPSHVIARVLRGLRMEQNDKPSIARRRLIGRKIFGAMIGKGALHDLYYLTPRGAKVVAELHQIKVSNLLYPKGEPQFMRDYFHRQMFIDFHIDFVAWCKREQHQIEQFYRYFNKTKQGIAHTQITCTNGKIIIPDGIAVLHDRSGKRHLYIVEVHHEQREKSIKQQIQQHLSYIENGEYAAYFGNPVTSQIISVRQSGYTRHTAP